MKREAVQEERQRGAKLQPKQQNDDLNPTSSVRDLTVDRIMEAEQISESRTGDNAIPYLRVGSNSMVPQEYKVSFINSSRIAFVFTLFIFRFLYYTGCCFTFVPNGE